jgi:hypothetical protein
MCRIKRVPLDPLTLMETSPGKFSLLLRDLDEMAASFEAAGHSGSGSSWQTVALHIVENEMDDVAESVEFDSEADTFCARSEDRAALQRLGKRLSELVHHPKRLAKIIKRIPDWRWVD